MEIHYGFHTRMEMVWDEFYIYDGMGIEIVITLWDGYEVSNPGLTVWHFYCSKSIPFWLTEFSIYDTKGKYKDGNVLNGKKGIPSN